MGKWKYGLICEDHLVGAIKSLPTTGDQFHYWNCDGSSKSLKHRTVKDVQNTSENTGVITLDNGETYIFYSISGS